MRRAGLRRARDRLSGARAVCNLERAFSYSFAARACCCSWLQIVVLAALRMRVRQSLRVFHALQREDSGEQTARRGYSRRSPPSFSKARAACAASIGGSRDRARAGFARIWPRKAESRFKSAFWPRAYPKRLRGYPLCALPAGKLAGANFMARPPVLRRRCNLGSGLGTCPGAVSHIGGQEKAILTCRNSPLSHALSP